MLLWTPVKPRRRLVAQVISPTIIQNHDIAFQLMVYLVGSVCGVAGPRAEHSLLNLKLGAYATLQLLGWLYPKGLLSDPSLVTSTGRGNSKVSNSITSRKTTAVLPVVSSSSSVFSRAMSASLRAKSKTSAFSLMCCGLPDRGMVMN